jgi:hypothetical protein
MGRGRVARRQGYHRERGWQATWSKRTRRWTNTRPKASGSDDRVTDREVHSHQGGAAYIRQRTRKAVELPPGKLPCGSLWATEATARQPDRRAVVAVHSVCLAIYVSDGLQSHAHSDPANTHRLMEEMCTRAQPASSIAADEGQ